jgi:DNA-binding LacI/PurR family transcriptional regulator
MNSSKARSGTTRSVGLCLHQPRRRVPLEPFWVQFMRGTENALAARSMSLLLQVVVDFDEEVATHRRWQEAGQIAGVIVVDPVENDQRLPILHELGLPAVLLGGDRPSDGLAIVTMDAAPTMNAIMDHLAAQGHRAVTRVTGPAEFQHTRERDAAFQEAGSRLGMQIRSITSDYTADGGRIATQQLLTGDDVPTALVYDNDVMALAGLAVLRESGLRVPQDMAIVAWDDSIQCQLASPPLSATARDLVAYGALAADSLLDLFDDRKDVHRRADHSVLVVRASSDAAAALNVG